MSGRQHSVCPSFGIDYAARRLSPEDIEGVDLTSWKSLATGAECIDLTALHAFSRLVEPAGFNPTALIAAYGLAEATLLVTGTPLDQPISALRIDKSSLRSGQPVAVLDCAQFTGQQLPGTGWIAGLGPAGSEVSVTRPWHCDTRPARQCGQVPSEIMLVQTTRSPTRTRRTSAPAATTLPANSWPRIVPFSKPGVKPWNGNRSAPQIAVAETSHDRIARLEDRRIGHGVDADVAGCAQDDGPHAGCSISTR